MDTNQTLSVEGAKLVSTFYKNYRTYVFNFLRNKLHDHKTAEDITSNVFAKVMEAVLENKYKNQDNPKAWIGVIAHNEMVNHFRYTKKFIRIKSGESVPGIQDKDMSPAEILVNLEFLKNFSLAVDKLPEKQREVLRLRMQKMPFKDMVKTLGVKSSTLRGWHRRAKNNLRNILEEDNRLFDI